MPLNINFVQILLHLLNFIILAGGLTLLLFVPIRKFLSERREKFAKQEEQNRLDAEENRRLKAELEQQKAELNKEMELLRQKTEQETARAAKEYIDSCKAEAAAIIAKAEQEAEKRKEQILDSAQTEIGELVIGAAQKLLGEASTPEQTRALYDVFLKQSEPAESSKEKKS